MVAADLTLRVATPHDSAAIRALTRAAYAKWIPVVGREPRPMTEDYEAAVLVHRFDLLVEGGETIALIETEVRGDHLFIINIAVAPDRQGQGLGRRLLAQAETLARLGGLASVRLLTNQKMAANIALYRAVGFVIDREEPMSDGVTTHMTKTLAVPRLVFLPGMGASATFWRPLADALPAGWDKVRLNWPGLGDEPPDPAVQSFDDLVARVEAHLADGPCDLLAQSMGGYVALQVALRRPDRARRMVLSVTSGGLDLRGLGGADWRAGYGQAYPKAAAWGFAPARDLSAELARIACPVLLLWGGADPISPVAVGERLCDLLPDARLHVTPGADHDLVQTHARELAPLVADFLAPS